MQSKQSLKQNITIRINNPSFLKGNNKMSINLLAYPKNEEGFVSFKEAILCAQNTSLSFKLRSKYVELILIMFVDVNENVSFLDNLIYSFVSCVCCLSQINDHSVLPLFKDL